MLFHRLFLTCEVSAVRVFIDCVWVCFCLGAAVSSHDPSVFVRVFIWKVVTEAAVLLTLKPAGRDAWADGDFILTMLWVCVRLIWENLCTRRYFFCFVFKLPKFYTVYLKGVESSHMSQTWGTNLIDWFKTRPDKIKHLELDFYFNTNDSWVHLDLSLLPRNS